MTTNVARRGVTWIRTSQIELVQALRDSIDQTRIDTQVQILRDALLTNAEFHVLYW